MAIFTSALFFTLGILSWPFLREFSWVEKFKNRLKSHGLFKGQKVSQAEVRTQLFFHDLMNQIHGLTLFLSHQVQGRKVMTAKEAELMLHELDVLQSLVSHHFQMPHRNLRMARELVSFEEVKEGLYSILESYFPDHRWQVNFQGRLCLGMSEVARCLVHRPSFFRIITNVVKNVQEKNSAKLQLNFDYQETGLMITVKNSLTTRGGQDFPWQEKNTVEGMGLFSMAFLAQELGGYSRFFVDNSWWITQIFLPNPRKMRDSTAEYASTA